MILKKPFSKFSNTGTLIKIGSMIENSFRKYLLRNAL